VVGKNTENKEKVEKLREQMHLINESGECEGEIDFF